MTRRTYESDAAKIEDVDDLDDLVQDKREGWRQNSDKARRRQRRYKNRLTREFLKMVHNKIKQLLSMERVEQFSPSFLLLYSFRLQTLFEQEAQNHFRFE